MAFLKIDSGPIEATDKLREVPKDKWHELMVARRLHMKTKLAYDCRCLVEFVDDAEVMHEQLGYPTAELMVREGYDLKPEEIDVAVRWLRLNPPKEAISLDTVKRLAGWGTNRFSRDSNTTSTIGRGRTYILARLDRDGKMELAAKVRAGVVSANAAAIEAGYRQKPTALEQVKKLMSKLAKNELVELRDLIDRMLL